MYNIIIDNRETDLINLFKKCFSEIYVSNLDVGDIAICEVIDTKVEVVALFERKTVSDMIASVKDGRYKEQKVRLMSYHIQNKTKKLYYILEGDTSKLNPTEEKLFWGSWISSQVRDGMETFRTLNIGETFKLVIKLLERIIKEPSVLNISKYQSEYYTKHLSLSSNTSNDVLNTTQVDDDKEVNISYLSSIKSRKKDNITPKLYHIMSLGLIPNVSNSSAEAIISKYGSMIAILSAYKSIDSIKDLSDNDKNIKKKYLLADIKISDKRKLGKNASEKVFEYLVNC